MNRKGLLYIIILVFFLLVVVALYFQGKQYAARYEKEMLTTGEMTIRVKPAPSGQVKDELLPPPEPGKE